MAYRTAEQTRWQQFDFVVGYEIKLSERHPCPDMCDDLAGKYPKSFKWTGWHPNDMCYCVSILKNEDEFWRDMEDGTDGGSVNEVEDVPEEFKEWVADNSERIEAARQRGTEPYFIKDNETYVGKVLKESEKKNTINIDNDDNLHTKRETKQIIEEWRNRVIRNISNEAIRYDAYAELHEKFIKTIRDAKRDGDTDCFIDSYNRARKVLTGQKKQNTSELTLTNEQKKRLDEFSKEIGVKRSQFMTVKEADVQSANPNYADGTGTSINCQTCAPPYVLRSQGFDICAKSCTPGSVSDWIAGGHSFDIWENIDGTDAIPTKYYDWMQTKGYNTMNPERYKEFFEGQTKEKGIYILTIGWESGDGHATILQRFADDSLAYIEPQHYNGKTMKRSIEELCNGGMVNIASYSRRGIMRVDDKLLKHYVTDFVNGKKYDVWSIFTKH